MSRSPRTPKPGSAKIRKIPSLKNSDPYPHTVEGTFSVILLKDVPGIKTIEVRGRRRLSRMFNDTYNLLAGTNGDSEWLYRGAVHHRGPGETALFEPGEVRIDLKIHSPLDYRVICIEKSYLDWILADHGSRSPRGDFHFRAAVAKDFHLSAALQDLSCSIQSGSSSLERDSILSEVGAILLARHSERPVKLHKPTAAASIQKAYEMLVERYPENLSLDTLASAAGLSRFHLVSAFRKRYGLPPHTFQLAVRIAKARSMLAEGMPGTEVAHALGFSDHAHLIRQFKRWQGVPPRSFANAILRV